MRPVVKRSTTTNNGKQWREQNLFHHLKKKQQVQGEQNTSSISSQHREYVWHVGRKQWACSKSNQSSQVRLCNNLAYHDDHCQIFQIRTRSVVWIAVHAKLLGAQVCVSPLETDVASAATSRAKTEINQSMNECEHHWYKEATVSRPAPFEAACCWQIKPGQSNNKLLVFS